MSADEFRNVMLNGYAWRRFHGHGRHEAAMGSNPDIGETTERLTPFSDQPPSRLRTPHSPSSPVSLGSLGKERTMKLIWKIFVRDVRQATRNVIAVIVAMGLVIVPALYAWYNIAASWDPYGNTKALKVAWQT